MRASRGLVTGDPVERPKWLGTTVEVGIVLDPMCGPNGNYAEVFWFETGDLTLVAHSSIVLQGPKDDELTVKTERF
jgi:hypothetical protein